MTKDNYELSQSDGAAALSRYVILSRVRSPRARSSPRAKSIAVLSVLPLAIAAACAIDGTLSLPGAGKGLAQHYGFWAIFATTPLILVLTSRLVESFVVIMRDVGSYCAKPALYAGVGRLVTRHVASLSLRSRSAWVYAFVMLTMLLWWVVNIIDTLSPLRTYGHDVFDAAAHPAGFVVTKAYLLLAFGAVYATAVFASMHVTVSMVTLLRVLAREDALLVNLFHRDNCGGTSRFGNVNLIILMILANFFTVIYAMYVTHRTTYAVMLVSLVACSVLAILQSIVAVYFIHQVLARKKRALLDDLARRLGRHFDAALESGDRFPTELLALRSHLLNVHTFPYAKGTSLAVNVIRFAPAAVAVIGYLRLLVP